MPYHMPLHVIWHRIGTACNIWPYAWNSICHIACYRILAHIEHFWCFRFEHNVCLPALLPPILPLLWTRWYWIKMIRDRIQLPYLPVYYPHWLPFAKWLLMLTNSWLSPILTATLSSFDLIPTSGLPNIFLKLRAVLLTAVYRPARNDSLFAIAILAGATIMDYSVEARWHRKELPFIRFIDRRRYFRSFSRMSDRAKLLSEANVMIMGPV